MADSIPQVGGRIRQLRRQRSISQAAFAKDLGISSSYLNLIEHNRRNLTVPLLLTLAQKFGLEIGDLTAGDEVRLSGDLLEMFSDDLFGDLDLTNHDLKEFANSSPAVARAIVLLYDRYRETKISAASMQDRKPENRLASEQVSDFLQAHVNYFHDLELVALRVACDLGEVPLSFDRLTGYLMNVFGIMTRLTSSGETSPYFDRENARLTIPDITPLPTRLFALAKCLGENSAYDEIEQLVAKANFSHPSVEALARGALASYVAGAILMPYERFLKAAKNTRYDIERLAMQFGVSFEQVCHRLTTLQRPGATGISFHLIRTDIAGNISKRFSISGIQIPRYGGACPRWNVYEAFMQPGRITIQVSQMPDKSRFFCIARTLIKGDNRHNGELAHMSIGLGCDLSDAHNLVYSDGIELENPSRVTPVGVSCRICPRQNCSIRAFPALLDS